MTTAIIDKNYKGLIRACNGDYIFDGDLVIQGNLDVRLDDRLVIKGYNTVTGWMGADCTIIVEKYQEIGRYQIIGGSQKIGGSQEISGSQRIGEFQKIGGYSTVVKGRCVMLSIESKGVMKTGLSVFAGICNWRDVEGSDKTITCAKMEGGEIGYGILKETGEVEKKKVTLELTSEQIEQVQALLSEGG